MGAEVLLRQSPWLDVAAGPRFRPNDTFDVNLNNTARRVDIRLYTLDGRPVRTLSSSVSTRFYEIEWNLKDDNGKVLGNGPYLAQLTVTYIDGSSAQQTAAVVVVR